MGFRRFVESEATALKLSGWVQNLVSGDVKGFVQGPKIEVDRLLEKIKRGPEFSKVKNLDVKSMEIEASMNGFRVLPDGGLK